MTEVPSDIVVIIFDMLDMISLTRWISTNKIFYHQYQNDKYKRQISYLESVESLDPNTITCLLKNIIIRYKQGNHSIFSDYVLDRFEDKIIILEKQKKNFRLTTLDNADVILLNISKSQYAKEKKIKYLLLDNKFLKWRIMTQNDHKNLDPILLREERKDERYMFHKPLGKEICGT